MKEGFKPKEYKKQDNVFRLGKGLLTAPKYIRFEVREDTILIEGWVGAYGLFELGLTGFVGAVPKKSLRKKIDKLVLFLD